MDAKQLIFLSAFLMLTGSVAGAYVGTAPGVKDLGVVERGETREVTFYLVTNIDRPFNVNPGFRRPQSQIYLPGGDRRYDFDPEQASQEDISEWVNFRQNSYLVDPRQEFAVALDNGNTASAQGSVTFDLSVPRDAEPGYHAGAVHINPRLGTGEDGGTAVTTLGLTQFVFVFKVPGAATRNITILGVNAIRTGEDRARFDFLVRNQGTVTTRLARADTGVFDRFGNLSGTVTTGGMYISPGQTKVVQTYWRGEGVDSGEFRVSGDLNYLTGKAFIDDTVSLSDYISVRQVDEGPDERGVPWWMILMALILVGVLMYSFDFDPVWIVMVVGVIGISAYILVSNLPLYIIGVLILLSGLIVLYRWF